MPRLKNTVTNKKSTLGVSHLKWRQAPSFHKDPSIVHLERAVESYHTLASLGILDFLCTTNLHLHGSWAKLYLNTEESILCHVPAWFCLISFFFVVRLFANGSLYQLLWLNNGVLNADHDKKGLGGKGKFLIAI